MLKFTFKIAPVSISVWDYVKNIGANAAEDGIYIFYSKCVYWKEYGWYMLFGSSDTDHKFDACSDALAAALAAASVSGWW